ncbi:hypothetical protein NQD34_012962, partial [Periophthalmus magnuspinnatus]
SDLKQELAEEGSRSRLLSTQSCFNQRCCIRCCAPFTFLLNPKRQCGDCGYNVCRSCRLYNKKSKGWLCSSCQKHRLLKTQSLEWFYTNVKRRFKRFGSAKVLKTLYKKHLTEHNILSELTDGSGYEESVCNDDSICGSDSTFYRQTEEHSMSETLTVARRVAEEAIDEAISKAEVHTYCQEKQNEAHYLRQHRGELIEELATTIVEKIISRRKTLAQIKSEYDQDLTHTYYDHYLSPQQQGLWRCHSLSLLDTGADSSPSDSQSLKKEGPGASLSPWKSVDRLDHSALKSPDGNWIVFQSGQLPHPGLLTKRKSQMYSALERESGAVSAYEAMDSDCEPDHSWGTVLNEIHKKMGQSDLLEGLDLDYVGGRRGSRDSEGNYWKSNKALLNKKVPVEIRKPSSSRRTSIIDMNFNLDGGTEEDDTREELEERKVRRPRKKRRSKREANALCGQNHSNTDTLPPSSDAVTPETLTSGAITPDLQSDISGLGANQINRELAVKLQQLAEHASITDSSTNVQNSVLERNSGDYMDLDEGETDDKTEDLIDLDNEAKNRLYKLVSQSRLLYLSSTDDDLDKEGISEEEDTQPNKDLKFKLCHLEQQVKSTQFSSTEDELDKIGLDEHLRQQGEDEEIAVKVCKQASQVNATQFSSTEDELDRVGCAEEAIDDAVLWKLQAQRGEQVRNLAGLVSICQFSSTEDELDRVGQDEIDENEVTCSDFRRRNREESIGDLDVNMFELREDYNYLEMSKGDIEGDTEPDTKEGGKYMGYKTITSLESEFMNEVEDDGPEKSDSEEDEVEFNRIINSMLMMTLEDMEMVEQNLGETNVKVKEEEGGLHNPDNVGGGKDGEEDNNTGKIIEKTGSQDGSNVLSGKISETDSKEKVNLGVNTAVEAKEELGGILGNTQEKEVMEERMKSSDTDVRLESNQEKSGVFVPPEVHVVPQRYSAQSLSSITTEVLKVLNATEQLLRETEGVPDPLSAPSAPLSQNYKQLDQQLCRLEENVYIAAGSVYDLETELEDLEECARAVCSSTSQSELRYLEEQVATAATKVQQSDMQISDIAARIAALRSAGLNVDPQPTFTKTRTSPAKCITLDASRQQRRLLPAPPTKDGKKT